MTLLTHDTFGSVMARSSQKRPTCCDMVAELEISEQQQYYAICILYLYSLAMLSRGLTVGRWLSRARGVALQASTYGFKLSEVNRAKIW